jgi:integrase
VPKSEIKPLDARQVKKLLDTAWDTQPYLYPLYVLDVTTGMRSGEILGLQWQDVDLDAGTVQVRRTVFNGVVSTPKTSRSNRGITSCPR